MTKQQLVNYLKKSFITGSIKTIVVAISTIVLLPLIIHKIGMETYGLISLTLIFGGMVVMVDFGVAKSVTLLIGESRATENENSIIGSALIVSMSLLAVIGIIFLVLILFNIPILGEKIQVSQQIKNFILVAGFFSLAFMLINNLLAAILEAYFLSHYINIGFTISAVLVNVFIYVASIATDSIYALLMAPAASFATLSLYFLYVIRVHTNVGLSKPSKRQLKKIFSTSYKFFNIGAVNSLIIPGNKYLLIYVTGSSEALGIFDICLKIAMIANSFLNSIAQPLFGIFSSMQENKKEIFNIAKKAAIIIFILYLMGVVTFIFVGEYISLLIDEQYSDELYLIGMILLIGLTFSAVSEPFYRALLGRNKLNEALYLKMLILVFNIIFYLALNNENSLVRVSLSYSIGVFLSSLIIIIYYVRSNKNVIVR